jgi:hypothetical protein
MTQVSHGLNRTAASSLVPEENRRIFVQLKATDFEARLRAILDNRIV